MPVRIPETTVRGPSTATSAEVQRELAKRTAAKIDQIESEMISGAGPATAPLSATMPMGSLRDTRPASRAPGGNGVATRGPAVPGGAGAEGDPASVLPPLEFSTSVVLGDTMAGLGGIQVETSALAPELEEAAILYANAQPQAAAATLRAALERGRLEGHARQAWLMLFDVLQAAGEKAQFESLAIEYAARFERSPPPWPEGQIESEPSESSGRAPTVVRIPIRLDGAASRQLETARRALAASRPVTIDFTAIVEFDAEGAALACSFFDSLAAITTDLAVLGASRLHEVASAAIESGRRDDSDGGWKLALAALRVLGEQQAFDDLSIDYCVTYEVSPPSWEPMPPNVRTAAARPKGPKQESVEQGSATVDGGAFVLSGELVGRMASDLAALRDYAEGRADVIVDCRGLRRLDFVAAGELLNEVVVLASSGKSVLFAEPIPIVEALLVVMGIHEVVEIRRRKV
jgi:anti-anti-sigma regulatory factor